MRERKSPMSVAKRDHACPDVTVNLRYFAAVAEAAGTRGETVELPAGTTAGDLRDALNARTARPSPGSSPSAPSSSMASVGPAKASPSSGWCAWTCFRRSRAGDLEKRPVWNRGSLAAWSATPSGGALRPFAGRSRCRAEHERDSLRRSRMG